MRTKILKEDPDTAAFNGRPIYYDDWRAITFGIFTGRGKREFISAKSGNLPREVDDFFYRNKGAITHAKLPYVAIPELRDRLEQTTRLLDSVKDIEIRGTVPVQEYSGERLVGLRTYLASLPILYDDIKSGSDSDRLESMMNTMLENLGIGYGIYLKADEIPSVLGDPVVKKLVEVIEAYEDSQDGFDRYGDYNLTGRAWYIDDTLLVSFWLTPDEKEMERVAKEIMRRYGVAPKVLVQNDNFSEDEWAPLGQKVTVIGDEDILAEIKELSKQLHITTGVEKEQIRKKIKELKAKAGIKDEPPGYGANKKANVAKDAGYPSTAAYTAASTQESLLKKSLTALEGLILESRISCRVPENCRKIQDLLVQLSRAQNQGDPYAIRAAKEDLIAAKERDKAGQMA